PASMKTNCAYALLSTARRLISPSWKNGRLNASTLLLAMTVLSRSKKAATRLPVSVGGFAGSVTPHSIRVRGAGPRHRGDAFQLTDRIRHISPVPVSGTRWLEWTTVSAVPECAGELWHFLQWTGSI